MLIQVTKILRVLLLVMGEFDKTTNKIIPRISQIGFENFFQLRA